MRNTYIFIEVCIFAIQDEHLHFSTTLIVYIQLKQLRNYVKIDQKMRENTSHRLVCLCNTKPGLTSSYGQRRTEVCLTAHLTSHHHLVLLPALNQSTSSSPSCYYEPRKFRLTRTKGDGIVAVKFIASTNSPLLYTL